MLRFCIISHLQPCITYDASSFNWISFASIGRFKQAIAYRSSLILEATSRRAHCTLAHALTTFSFFSLNVQRRRLSSVNLDQLDLISGQRATAAIQRLGCSESRPRSDPVSSFADHVVPTCLHPHSDRLCEGNTTLDRFCRLPNQAL